MFAPANQTHFSLTVEGLNTDLQVVAFTGREAISQPFAFDVELVSEQPSLDLETLLHKPAFLQLSPDGNGIHGLIYRAVQGDSGKRLTRYAVTLRPQLAYLAHRINQRIFQNLSVPKIIGLVLEEHGIQSNAYAFKVGAIYPERLYCVQYDESDLHFIQRLCEEEGIHYHFQHSKTAHKLVFGDDQTVFPKLAPVAYQQDSGMVASDPVIKRFDLRLETRTSRITRRDYDFEKPRITLESESRGDYLPDLEDYDYPARFVDRERGKHLAKRSLERHRSDYRLAEGKSDQPLLVSGHFLALTQHPKANWNDLWLLTEIFHEGKQPQVLEESAPSDTSASKDDFHQGYRNRFQATPWDVPNRPALHHPKPRILGSQSAVVTGPKDEEIHCDEYGRVKVQFHWDRKGQADDKTSGWLRVSSAWAGAHYGGIAIPRIGMEVLVTFLEGDPDQPLITGCLYHKENAVPYDLPANKTRSTFKTLSSPGGAGFNELRIEDKKGAEQIFLHAQRDWDENVEQNQKIRVGNERHDTVENNSYTHLNAEEHRTTYGDRKVEARADDYLSVGVNQHVKIGTGLFIEAGQEIFYFAGNKVVLEAGAELTLKAGGSFISIDDSGVALSGPEVKVNSGGAPGVGALAEMLMPSALQQADAAQAGSVLTPALANILDTMNQGEPINDAAHQPLTHNDQPARAASDTCTNGCPVSMVTGEELLTLTDGHLDGVLPFKWTRLYRTSAVEIDNGLGFGWSHALSHRLHSDGEELIWTDSENRITRFPRPTAHLPVIHNSLAESAIFLGEADDLVLLPSRSSTCFYHFRQERLVAITDAYRNRLSIRHGETGQLERIDNHAGRSLFFRYANNHLVAVDYQQQRHRYDDDDRPQAPWVTLQTVATYQYNEAGQLFSASNALGETEHYYYDTQHVILERHLAGGAIFYWEWEREGKQSRCLHHWANFGQLDARYEWDDNGTVKVINRDGTEQLYVHDENARLISQTDPNGAKHQKTYDKKGQLIAEKDPLGSLTQYQYNDVGRLVAVLPGDDAPIYYQYEDGFVSQVYRDGALWQYQRNTQGAITAQTDPHANVTRYSYTPQGQLKAIYQPDGSSHHLVCNDLGQLIEETLPDGGIRRYRYDALGRNISRQDESGAVSHYQWDALGHLTQVTLPNGATRAYSYNAYGNVTGERDELGRVTRYEYVANLHLISRRINSDGSELKYRYDHDRLQLTEIENERGEHHRISYHSNDLISEEVGFDGRKTAYQYDLAGHLIEKIEYPDSPDIDERVTLYKRDAAGRLCEKTLPDGSKVEYRYDLHGRLVGVNDGHWPLAYEYDLQDRLVTEQQGWATLQYQYNALGQLKGLRLPDGNQLDYHYHRGGELSTLKLNGENLTGHHFTAGREQLREQGQLISQYQYDEQGRLKAHVFSQIKARQGAELRISGHALAQRYYNYSPNGNLELISDSRKGQKSYRYDPLNRLLEVRGSAPEWLTHDPAGNLLGQSESGLGCSRFADVKGNRVLRQGDRHFEYDAYGNLSHERLDHGQALVRHYRYDSLHRLSGVTLADGSDATYRYDAFGRRIAKEHDGQQTEFVWLGEQLLAERRLPLGSQGSQHYRSYLYEPDSFKPLVLLQGEGSDVQPYYFQLDHLGTPQEITDRRGQIVWSAHYRAYGQLRALDVALLENPLRFQGQYYDGETGLHYNRHRYYNPTSGRFLTPDPIKLAGGLNAYRYVPNPTGWVDPLGLTSCPGEAGKKAGKKKKLTASAIEHLGLPEGLVFNLADEDMCPPPILVYRRDSRPPAVIFKNGFKPLGEDMDLFKYAQWGMSSGYVSTSKSTEIAHGFSIGKDNLEQHEGYFYAIRSITGYIPNSTKGTDVNKTLKKASPSPKEREIAIAGNIRTEDIHYAQHIDKEGKPGKVTINPYFKTHLNLNREMAREAKENKNRVERQKKLEKEKKTNL